MQPFFHLSREQKNQLTHGRVRSQIDIGAHFHSQIEIYLVRKGELSVFANGSWRILHPGELAVFFSYDLHGYRTKEEVEVEYIILPTHLCGEFLPFLTNRHAFSNFISDPDVYDTILHAMEQLKDGMSELLERGYIYVILGTVLDCLPTTQKRDAQDPHFFAEVLIYIEQHFREELTLTMLASAFGYHPSYLSRTFRESIGISFVKYLSMLRLREAILLLRKGELSVTACALESGFGSVRSFYRAFYEEFKCTPREYLSAERK